jgi:maleate cis-trans isomerase
MPARVGLIIPWSNRMVEQEMVHAFPPGVQAHVARLRMTGPHHMPLDRLLPRITEAAATLRDAKCDVVAFHCTATSMEEGADGEARIVRALEQAGPGPVISTAASLLRAFAALAARRIVLITPYDTRTTEDEAEFLRAAGYEVPHAEGLALAGSDAYCATPATFWQDRALAAARPDADAIFISCANISTFAVIEDIERATGRPVVTSNQAVVWDTLRQLRWRDRTGCPGRLFDTL